MQCGFPGGGRDWTKWIIESGKEFGTVSLIRCLGKWTYFGGISGDFLVLFGTPGSPSFSLASLDLDEIRHRGILGLGKNIGMRQHDFCNFSKVLGEMQWRPLGHRCASWPIRMWMR